MPQDSRLTSAVKQMVETTAVQSVQVSAVATSRRVEVKRKTFKVEIMMIYQNVVTWSLLSQKEEWIPSLWMIEGVERMGGYMLYSLIRRSHVRESDLYEAPR